MCKRNFIKLFLLASLLSSSSIINATNTDNPSIVQSKKPSDANVIGHVVDAKTGEHLIGITIAIKGTNYGASTDKTGHYMLKNLKEGEITLIMRGLGYLSQEKTIRVKDNTTIEINFEAKEDNVSLDEIVVSSSRQATLRRLAPTLVSVIDEKIFDRANVNNLAQGLVFKPGVRVENNCQNCGFNQVRINGLDGRYSQILINSRPIMSALAGVYGLEQIPSNMIDRVEVVRGGGSALYGSSAIAGVINIITKEPTTSSVTINESMNFTGLKSLDNNLGFNASVVSDDNNSGASIFGNTRYRNPYDMNGDDYSEIGFINAKSLGIDTYYKINPYSKISLEFHAMYEDRRGGDHVSGDNEWPVMVASVAEATKHNVYSGSLKYDLFSKNYKHHLQAYTSAQWVTRHSYYGGIGEVEVDDIINPDEKTIAGKPGYPIPADKYGVNFGISRGLTSITGIQYSYDIDKLWFMPAQFMFGTEYSTDYLSDKMPIRSWDANLINGKFQSKNPELEQRVNNFSQFAQLEWKNDNWSILIGSRFDENNKVKETPVIISPRATLRYNPNRNWSIRASYAKGFRAPQVFDEDLHIGVVQGEAQKVQNADDLTPEYSHSFSLSSDSYFYFGDASLNFLVEGFYTSIINPFTNVFDKEVDNIKWYTRRNYDIGDNGEHIDTGARVFGVNLEAKFAWHKFQIQGGLTLASSKYNTAQEWGIRSEVKNMGDDEKDYLNVVAPKTDSDFELKEDKHKKNKFKNISMTSREYLRTPSVYGYFSLGYNIVKGLDLSLTGDYTGSMYVPHSIGYGQSAAMTDKAEVNAGNRKAGTITTPDVDDTPHWDELTKTKGFFNFGAKLSYQFNISKLNQLQVYTGISNIFNSFQNDYDEGPDRDSAYIYGPTMPRSAYFGIKYNFQFLDYKND